MALRPVATNLQSMQPLPSRFNHVLPRLFTGDRLIRSKVGKTSPRASGLLPHDRNATVRSENSAFVTRFDPGQTTLAGRKRKLAPGAELGHRQLQCAFAN